MSVRKRDSRYKKPWVAVVHSGRDENGKTIRVERSFALKREAEAWERREKARQRHLASMPGEPITVGQLLEEWLEQGPRLHDWSPRHTANSTRIVGRDLSPLHPIRLDELRTSRVESLFAELRVRGVSPHTIKQARNALRAALNGAVRRQLVDRNVAALAQIPEVKRKPPKVIDRPDVERLLEVLDGERLGPFYVTAMTLALRPGEAAGLRWEDVDFDERRVAIVQTVQYSDGSYHVRPTKTQQARTIPLPDVTARALETQRLNQVWEMGDEPAWVDSGLVFTNTTGGPLHVPYARRRLQELCARAGLPRVTVYQLRHTGATLLLSLGVPLEQIQQIMGHSTMMMTRQYVQVSEELQRESLGRLDALLGKGVADA